MDNPDFTLADARVAIVGLGLMGGSLALAIKDHCAEITGVDADSAALAHAVEHGIVRRAADFQSAVASCDLLVLAAPVQAIIEQLNAIGSDASHRPTPTVVIDLGSTKTQIVAAMEKLPPHFDPIGGHPMCGKETSGLLEASADLFHGATFALTPLERTSSAAFAVAHELVRAVGASPLVLSAAQHDKLAAVTSHMPYAAAAALVRAALAIHDDDLWPLAASGFRDTTRLAASDITMMVDILITNRDAVLNALLRYRAELDALAAIIELGDARALRAALAPAQSKRAQLK